MATPKELGYNFISQSPYLQNDFVPNVATFNVSPNMNTGIMSQYPYPYPIISQGGGDGGGPINPGGPDYGYTGPGSTGSPEGFNIDDIGEGTIDDEDIIDQINLNRMDMIRAGGAFLVGGPFSAANSLRRSNNRNRQAEIDRINSEINFDYGSLGGIGAREAQRRQDEAGGSVQSSDDYSSSGGQGDQGATGANFDGDFATDSASYDLAKGGRVGYSRGKLVEGIMGLFKPSTKVGFRSRKDIPLEQYSKMEAPITTKIMEEIPESQLKKIFRTQELGLYSETPEILKAGNLMQRFTKVVNGKRVIDYERAEDILNVKLRGDETLDELFAIEFKTRPVERAYGGIVGMYR